jgi:prepilin-type N-terminal cleavage/methylation domain-containing protein
MTDRTITNDDRGFTLVELLISMALLSVVVTIVGGIIVSSLQADRTIREVTTSTTDGQLVMNAIEQTVRNSTAVSVVPNADGSSVFAVVRTTAGGTARCVAWFYDIESEAIFQRDSTSAISAPTPGAVGSEWREVSGGIVADDDATGTPYPVLQADGARGLAVRFAVEGGSSASTLFISSVTGRGPQSNVSPQCF